MSARSRGFPLFLTFDIDAETMWTARDPAFANRPVLMSQGAYGWKTGVWRIMDLLRRYSIHTTFFIPGLVVEQNAYRTLPLSYTSYVLENGEVVLHGLSSDMMRDSRVRDSYLGTL